MDVIPAEGKVSAARPGQGFTLIELLVAMVVLAILALLSFQVIRLTNGIWVSASSKISQFREARVAFEALTLRLSSATVDQYLAYQYLLPLPAAPAAPVPGRYGRHSELRFISGLGSQVVGAQNHPTHAVFFTAPLGYTNTSSSYARLPGLLNICGYYIEWSNVDPDMPTIIANAKPVGPYRFRLMQFLQPAENMALYSKTTKGSYDNGYAPVSAAGWQTSAMQATPKAARPLCDNVVALILLPCRLAQDTSSAIAPNFLYDSESTNADDALDQQNRLPPVLRVILYSIDERSAQKMASNATMPDLYNSGGALFTDPARLYPNPSTGDIGDVGRFETNLTALHLTYLRHESVLQLPLQPWNTQHYY